MALFAALANQQPLSQQSPQPLTIQAGGASHTAASRKAPFPVPVFAPNPEWQTDADIQGETVLWVSQSSSHPVATVQEAAIKDKSAKISGESTFHGSVILDEAALNALKPQRVRRPIVSPSGWQYTGDWQGWWLKDVLTAALHLPESSLKHQYVLQRNRLGHHQTLRLTPDVLDHALVASHVNGEPLPVTWGGPLWLLVFGRYHTIGLEQLLALEVSSAPSRLPSRTELYGLDDAGVIAEGKALECSNGQWTTVQVS